MCARARVCVCVCVRVCACARVCTTSQSPSTLSPSAPLLSPPLPSPPPQTSTLSSRSVWPISSTCSSSLDWSTHSLSSSTKSSATPGGWQLARRLDGHLYLCRDLCVQHVVCSRVRHGLLDPPVHCKSVLSCPPVCSKEECFSSLVLSWQPCRVSGGHVYMLHYISI